MFLSEIVDIFLKFKMLATHVADVLDFDIKN